MPASRTAIRSTAWPRAGVEADRGFAQRGVCARRAREARSMLWRYPTRILAVAALVTAVLAPGHARVADGTSGVRLHDAWLAAAAGNARVIEPRLTGGFAYGQFSARAAKPPASSTSPSAPASPSSQLYAAAARLQTLANADPAADHLRALGVAYLLIGSADEARDALERARAAAADDPRVLSDLSAALLARSSASEDTWDAVRALNHAERAWRLAPAMPEAAFNTALARERLHLRSEARKAWLAVQQLQPGTPWAAEAASHAASLSTEMPGQAWPRVRQELTERIAAGPALESGTGSPVGADELARRFPQAIREYLQEELLPSWGAAQMASDSAAAARRLAAADALCTALASHGDRACLQLIDRIDTATPEPRARLAAAHDALGRAIPVYRSHEFARSRPLFEHARTQFAAADGSIEAHWCDIYLAILDGRTGRQADGSARLRTMLSHANEEARALRARGAWLLGLNEVNSERFAAGLLEYSRARELFAAIGEHENLARIELLTAEALAKLGNRREGWLHFDRALEGAQAVHTIAARQVILVGASIMGLDDDLPDAARVIQEEFLGGSPQPASSPAALTEGLLYYFASLASIGETATAHEKLRLARHVMETVLDDTAKRRLEAEIASWEGRSLLAIKPRDAIVLLSRALALFQSLELHDRLPPIFQARGRAHLRDRDPAAARQDFTQGIAAVESSAMTLADETLRPAALGPAWPLVVDLIGIELDQNRPLDALALAERARGLSLTASAGACQDGDLDARRQCWIARLDGETAVVSYVVLPDRLAIWVLTRDGVQMVRQPIAAERLRAAVRHYRRTLEPGANGSSPGDTARASAALFDLLIRPIASWAHPKPHLVIVADDVLHGVPFGALFDARTQRYVLEDHVVELSPSVTHAAGAGPRRGGASWRDGHGRAVVVANPTVSGIISARLPPLPAAEREAAQLASLFEHVQVLTGTGATKSRLQSALKGTSLLHVASHALVNHRTPWRSYFVLAPDAGRTGEDLLFMSEISRLPLQTLRLAVLAACGSADGAMAGGGAVLSLARPFLAAGVPHVVATLWPVGDRASASLFAHFYEQLADGATPAAALREAQLALLRHPDAALRHPALWSPFVAIGGSASAPPALVPES
jgi:CHAT domain-containing protein